MDLIIPKSETKVIVKKLIVKKKHFFFGKKKQIGVIRILKRPTNIFIIFEDLRNKTIICKTSGSSGIIGSKRKKKSPQAVEIIFQSLYPYIKIYNIKKVRIVLNSRLNACFYVLLRCLEFYGIEIVQCSVKRSIAFNGCKGPKVRRV